MPIADELQKLQEMLRAGSLTPEEYEQAKRAVLSGGGLPLKVRPSGPDGA